jgi:hypothetical protein
LLGQRQGPKETQEGGEQKDELGLCPAKTTSNQQADHQAVCTILLQHQET